MQPSAVSADLPYLEEEGEPLLELETGAPMAAGAPAAAGALALAPAAGRRSMTIAAE